ncbi:MAG: thiol-disulfide oxidoreductase DCC family protein [Chthoniobacterales bacterium]
MKSLYVLFDVECAVCRRCRDWLSAQPAFVRLIFIPLQSPEIDRMFPGVKSLRPQQQLIVIGDNGDVYRGASAWLICLWALRRYRSTALRLANPVLRPFARLLCEAVSRNRSRISEFLSISRTDQMESLPTK